MDLRLRANYVASLSRNKSGPRRKLSEFPEHRNEKTDGAWARNRRPLFSRFVRNVAPLFRRWKSCRQSSKYFHGTTSKARSIKDDVGLLSPRWNIYSLAASVNLSLSFVNGGPAGKVFDNLRDTNWRKEKKNSFTQLALQGMLIVCNFSTVNNYGCATYGFVTAIPMLHF